MTGVGEPRPALLLAVGAPDGMGREEAYRRFGEGLLPGITGLSLALLPWLRKRGYQYAVALFGTGGLSADAEHRLLERTGGRVLINLICEPHAQRRALEQMRRFELATGIAVVNPSWAISATTRPLIARRLAHQARVRMPHCTHYPAGALTLTEHVQAHGHTYPVLLRAPGRHGSAGLLRFDDADALAHIDAAVPPCTVTDFVDFRSADGLWRKYRIVYAGDRLFRRHMLIDTEWNLVGAARRFMRDRPALLDEEQAWLEEPLTLENDSIEARVMHQFRAVQLDFGAIDCALLPDGDLLVFELNACLQLTNAPSQAISDRRPYEASNDEILRALVGEACARPDASPIRG
jgi:hypothetical protein